MTKHPTNNRFKWFMTGYIACALVSLLTANNPEKIKSNLQSWVDAYEGESHAALHPGQRAYWQLTYKEGGEIKHEEYRAESGCFHNIKGQKASCEKVWEKILSYDEMVEKADGYRKSKGAETCEETCGHYTLWMDDEVQCEKNVLPDNRDWRMEYLYACKDGSWVKK